MSEKWNVIMSPESKQELRDIHSYIANECLACDAAIKQVDRIIDNIVALDEMPHKFPLYEKEPWRSKGLHKLPVDNYIVFYVINENARQVIVFHVFYGGRNIEKIL